MLSRDDIVQLLGELAAELEQRGLHGDIFLVGGAAISVSYSTRRTTVDLDALFEPKGALYEAAQAIAERHGLRRGWLNDGVKVFLPGEDEHATLLFERPGLSVRVASPRYLFAMKMLAARVERDVDDIRLLYGLSGYDSVENALDDVARMYPHRVIPPRAQYLLKELFPSDSES